MSARHQYTTRSLVVSVHDVAPSTAESSRRWVDLLEERGLRASLLVVPGWWNGSDMDSSPSFVEWLGAAAERGHEVVQHGFSHVYRGAMESTATRSLVGRLLARGCEEFWHLSYPRARELLSLGRDVLKRHGAEVHGFVAPGWLMSPDAVDAARDLGYRYTCTHTAVLDLVDGRSIPALTTSQRPRSMLTRAGIIVNEGLVTLMDRRYSVARVAVHPADLWNVRLRESNLSLCGRLVAAGFVSTTYQELVASVRVNHADRRPTDRSDTAWRRRTESC